MGVLSNISKTFNDEHRQATVAPAVATTTTLADPALRSPSPSSLLADAAVPQLQPQLPPPIACPICDCPFAWSTIYEPGAFRCCDCDPPPGGWHAKTGGRNFVAKLLVIVEFGNRPSWEDWTSDLRPEPPERPRIRPGQFAGSSGRPASRGAIRGRARAAATGDGRGGGGAGSRKVGAEEDEIAF